MFPAQGVRTAWIAGIALVALAAGLWIARGHLKPSPNAPAPRAEAPPDSTLPGNVVDRALDLAADSTAIKTRWVDDVKELDLAALGGARREVFLRFANARACTCGCGYTLAGCREYDSTCETSGPLVRALYDSVRAGWISDARGIRERPSGR